MKAIELVEESLAQYEAALDIANRKLGIEAKIFTDNVKLKVQLEYMRVVAWKAAGKVEAAQ